MLDQKSKSLRFLRSNGSGISSTIPLTETLPSGLVSRTAPGGSVFPPTDIDPSGFSVTFVPGDKLDPDFRNANLNLYCSIKLLLNVLLSKGQWTKYVGVTRLLNPFCKVSREIGENYY